MVFKFKKILSDSNYDILLCECGNYGSFRSEQAAILASRALKKGIKEVVFDRGGFLYHGKIKALADAARENGLKL